MNATIADIRRDAIDRSLGTAGAEFVVEDELPAGAHKDEVKVRVPPEQLHMGNTARWHRLDRDLAGAGPVLAAAEVEPRCIQPGSQAIGQMTGRLHGVTGAVAAGARRGLREDGRSGCG